jgi:hypothetical protein
VKNAKRGGAGGQSHRASYITTIYGNTQGKTVTEFSDSQSADTGSGLFTRAIIDAMTGAKRAAQKGRTIHFTKIVTKIDDKLAELSKNEQIAEKVGDARLDFVIFKHGSASSATSASDANSNSNAVDVGADDEKYASYAEVNTDTDTEQFVPCFYHSHRGHTPGCHPRHVLVRNDKYYGSRPADNFRDREADWIILTLSSTDTLVMVPSVLKFVNSHSEFGNNVRSLQVSIGSASADEWRKLHTARRLTVDPAASMQSLELNVTDSLRNLILQHRWCHIKVEFIDNDGCDSTEQPKFVCCGLSVRGHPHNILKSHPFEYGGAMDLSYHSHKGHLGEFHPRNLLEESESMYASAPPSEFGAEEKLENDWIIFKFAVNFVLVQVPSVVHFRNNAGNLTNSVSLFTVSIGSPDTKWYQLHSEDALCFNSGQSESQSYRLDWIYDAAARKNIWANFLWWEYIKVQFVGNCGYADRESQEYGRFACRQISVDSFYDKSEINLTLSNLDVEMQLTLGYHSHRRHWKTERNTLNYHHPLQVLRDSDLWYASAPPRDFSHSGETSDWMIFSLSNESQCVIPSKITLHDHGSTSNNIASVIVSIGSAITDKWEMMHSQTVLEFDGDAQSHELDRCSDLRELAQEELWPHLKVEFVANRNREAEAEAEAEADDDNRAAFVCRRLQFDGFVFPKPKPRIELVAIPIKHVSNRGHRKNGHPRHLMINSDVYKMDKKKCPKSHELKKYEIHEFGCDLCERGFAEGNTGYGCRECDYDLCELCYTYDAYFSEPGTSFASGEPDWIVFEMGSQSQALYVPLQFGIKHAMLTTNSDASLLEVHIGDVSADEWRVLHSDTAVNTNEVKTKTQFFSLDLGRSKELLREIEQRRWRFIRVRFLDNFDFSASYVEEPRFACHEIQFHGQLLNELVMGEDDSNGADRAQVQPMQWKEAQSEMLELRQELHGLNDELRDFMTETRNTLKQILNIHK